jgi:hypothetical protein
MKIAIALVLTLVSAPVFAQSVSVLIDGKTYSCSPGGQSDCRDRVGLMKSKYTACMTSYSASYCFGSAIKPALDKTCPDSVQLCYDSCMKAYSNSYCYGECY